MRDELSIVWILLGVIKMREALVIQLWEVPRPRGQKRPQDDDIVEESAGESSDSSDDEIEDSTFRVEHRHGKGPANGSGSDEEEEEGDISDNDEEEEGGSEESEQEIPFHTTQRPIRLGSKRCIDYSGSGMTREV